MHTMRSITQYDKVNAVAADFSAFDAWLHTHSVESIYEPLLEDVLSLRVLCNQHTSQRGCRPFNAST